MRKNYAIKYITIIMIISAMVRLIFGFMMINFFSTSITYEVVTPEILRIAICAIVFVMLNMITMLIAGFVGAANWEEPENAVHIFVWGVVSLAFGIAANVLQIRCDYPTSIYTWITGVGVPALYTLAALVYLIFRPKRKKKAQN